MSSSGELGSGTEGWIHDHWSQVERLFSNLNLDYPGLELVKSAWEDGEVNAACEALLLYYASKQVEGAPFLTHSEDDYPFRVAIADGILENEFLIQGLSSTVPERPGEPGINWLYRGPKDDPEFAWLLNRHTYFYQLIRAYRETGDLAYIHKLNALLGDWILSNPDPDGWSFSAPWRALEAARRVLDSWVLSFYTLQAIPAFSKDTRLLLLYSLIDHARILQDHASIWGGNHLITEKLALFQIAVAFPEFKNSVAWRTHAKDVLRKEYLKQTYPDGGYKELAFHYHRIASENLLVLLRLLDFAGLESEEPALFRRGEAMWDYMLQVARPDGMGPLNNDSDLESIRTPRYLKLMGPLLKPEWDYFISGKQSGRSPRGASSRHFEWSGHVVMRDSWRAGSQWAFFDYGPYGSAHQHRDRLHLSVSAYGQDFLVDSGRYTYQPGRVRDYFQGPASHNVVLLDGDGTVAGPKTVSSPMQASWIQSPYYEMISAESPYARNEGKHRRTVFYRTGKYWIVLDEVLSFGVGEIEALWHTHPECRVKPFDWGIRLKREGVLLDLIPISPFDWGQSQRMGLESPDFHGWYSPNFNERIPSAELVFSHRSKGPRTFAWIIVPSRRETDEQALVEVESVSWGPGSVHLKLRLGTGGLDEVHLGYGKIHSISMNR